MSSRAQLPFVVDRCTPCLRTVDWMILSPAVWQFKGLLTRPFADALMPTVEAELERLRAFVRTAEWVTLSID